MKYGKSELPKSGAGEASVLRQGINYSGCEDKDQNRSMVNKNRKGGYSNGKNYPK